MSISLKDLGDRFNRAAQLLPGAAESKVEALAKVAEGLVKQEIQNVHAVDTGSMLNSTTTEKIAPKTYLVGPTVKYAPYVALGTSRMPARPFHKTAARRLQGMVNQGNLLRDLGL